MADVEFAVWEDAYSACRSRINAKNTATVFGV